MECAKIEELLSDYIDGTLDARTKSLVEEHLSTCKDCKQDLDSLKSAIKELGSLDAVKAPKDFLNQVHERIERRSWFFHLLRILFIPIRFKIPLHFAAVATTAIFVFVIFHAMQPLTQLEDEPTVSGQIKIAKKPVADAVKPSTKRDAFKTKQVLKEEAPADIDEKKPIELALLIPKKAPETPATMFYAPRKKEAGLPAPGVRAGESMVEEKEQAAALPSKERFGAKCEAVAIVSYLKKTLIKVKEDINLLEGKVLSIVYDKQTGSPECMTVEIPAKNYNAFLEKVNQIGMLQPPFPTVPTKDQKRVQIRIRFLSP